MAEHDRVAHGSAAFVGALEDALRAVERGETIGDEEAARELRELREHGGRREGARGQVDGSVL